MYARIFINTGAIWLCRCSRWCSAIWRWTHKCQTDQLFIDRHPNGLNRCRFVIRLNNSKLPISGGCQSMNQTRMWHLMNIAIPYIFCPIYLCPLQPNRKWCIPEYKCVLFQQQKKTENIIYSIRRSSEVTERQEDRQTQHCVVGERAFMQVCGRVKQIYNVRPPSFSSYGNNNAGERRTKANTTNAHKRYEWELSKASHQRTKPIYTRIFIRGGLLLRHTRISMYLYVFLKTLIEMVI